MGHFAQNTFKVEATSLLDSHTTFFGCATGRGPTFGLMFMANIGKYTILYMDPMGKLHDHSPKSKNT